MCLGIPGKIIDIAGDSTATIEIGGIKKEILLDILDEAVTIGDYVVIHSGFALKKIDEALAEETLNLLKGYFKCDI